MRSNPKLQYQMRGKFISFGYISYESYFNYLVRVPANDNNFTDPTGFSTGVI